MGKLHDYAVEFNRLAAKAREDGYEVRNGSVYKKEDLDPVNQRVAKPICEVMEYELELSRKMR